MRSLGFAFTLIMLGCFACVGAWADVWSSPVSLLAQRIVAKAEPGSAVTLNVKNISSLSAGEVNAVRTQLEAELRSRGLRIAGMPPSFSELRVTLSENGENYVWVAEVSRGDAVETIFMTVPRKKLAESQAAAPMTFQRRLLWEQDEQILDVVLVAAPVTGAIVLTPSKVALYRLQNTTWQESDAAPLPLTRPLPRDIRGIIVGGEKSPFEILLPGWMCSISGSNPYHADCANSDDPWPIYEGEPRLDAFFSPKRNFFTGAISRSGGNANLPSFYSAAMFGNAEWLFATTDGRLLYSSFVNTVPVPANWGSELTSMRTKCSPDSVVLASSDVDYTRADTVQGFHVIGREPVAVTAPVEFAGPVMVLRSLGETAIAVSYNLATGKYEAYLLSLFCNQ